MPAMPDANVSKRLQKNIVVYSALGMFVVGVAIAIVGVLPLARQLREERPKHLLVDQHLVKKTELVEQVLNGVKVATRFLGQRNSTPDHIEAYNQREITRAKLLTTLKDTQPWPLRFSTNTTGLQLFDSNSNLLASFGQEVPEETRTWPSTTGTAVTLNGPISIKDETFIVASAPLIATNRNNARAGTIMALYRTTRLQNIVEDYSGLGDSGQVILGSRQNKQRQIFFPLRPETSGANVDPKRATTVMEGLQLASTQSRGELFEPVAPMDESLIIAGGPIRGTDWAIIIAMNRAELFSSMNRKFAQLGSLVLGLILLGTFGMVILLRPLTGRLLLHADELKSQIDEKTAALNTELTERKRAEDSMRDSEALYHSLVDTLPINILRKDLEGRVTFGNRGYCESMGQELPDLLGKSDHELFPNELAEKYRHDDQKVVQTGEMFEDIEEHCSPDGERLYVHVLKAPVHDSRGGVVGTQVIFWDVTARRLAEEASEKAAAELARSNKELEQFAYVASHDLQEPLRMITSYTQLMAKRYESKLDKDAKEFMGFAVDGALRMQKLIQGLLEYSRVGTRGKPFEAVPCEEALAGAVANLKMAIDESKVRITRDPFPTVMGDPIQLTQLFQNLIGNAIKFRGKQVPQIHLGAQRKPVADAASRNVAPYEWIFSVRDNGIGIEQQYFDRVFTIFQRLHTRDQYPGTGIGLAICRKIVERHGGRIWIKSAPGDGTTFYFALPAID